MRVAGIALVALALSLASCGGDEQVAEAESFEDDNLELQTRVEELEQNVAELEENIDELDGKLYAARTAAAELASEAAAVGLAIHSIDAEPDGIGGIEVDTSDVELAHSSLESSISELEAAVAE